MFLSTHNAGTSSSLTLSYHVISLISSTFSGTALLKKKIKQVVKVEAVNFLKSKMDKYFFSGISLFFFLYRFLTCWRYYNLMINAATITSFRQREKFTFIFQISHLSLLGNCLLASPFILLYFWLFIFLKALRSVNW